MQAKKSNAQRVKAVLSVILIIIVCFLYYLIIESGVIPGADKDVDAKIAQLKQTEEAKKTVEGAIIDRNQEAITQAEEPGTPAICLFPEAYSSLIGYQSHRYGNSGIRKIYSSELLLGGKDKAGATIELTTDNDLQAFCYQLLGNQIGSIVIMENQSSQILSMVNRSDETIEYNVNEIDKLFDTYKEIPEFFYHRALLAQDPPGSTWKIVTAAAMLENGMDDFVYEDTTGEYHGIRNAGHVPQGRTNLEKALVTSSNTYFAKAGYILGGAALEESASKFLVGEPIPLDFTVLTSQLDLEFYQRELTEQTAFGQGRTTISPLQIAMILQAVVNDGEMQKPYLISKITDDGKVIQEGKREVLSTAVAEKTADRLKECLRKTAKSYGYEEGVYGTVYAKTGTAQISSGQYNHIYLVFATEEYTGIISMDRSSKSSSSLIPLSQELLDYLQKNM